MADTDVSLKNPLYAFARQITGKHRHLKLIGINAIQAYDRFPNTLSHRISAQCYYSDSQPTSICICWYTCVTLRLPLGA